MPKKKPAPKKQRVHKGPLTFDDIRRWTDAADVRGHDAVAYLRRRGVDARLFTISPSLVAVVDYLAGQQKTVIPEKAVLRFAHRALGSGTERQWFDGDGYRVNAIVDWAVRFVLPLWLKQAPNRYRQAHDLAKSLPSAPAMLWAQQMVETLHDVFNVSVSLEAAMSAPLTGAERVEIARVDEQTKIVVNVLAGAVARQVSRGRRIGDENDRGLCYQALTVMREGVMGEHRHEALATLPQLVDIVCAIQPGDSQGSVAERCRWPRPATRKTRAA